MAAVAVALDILAEKGVALDRQVFNWREMSAPILSKLEDDALTRVRVLLMSSVEAHAVRLSYGFARENGELRGLLARVRRVEQHQRTVIGWLDPPDESPLDGAVRLEQAAVEITAALARREPDPYLAQVYRFALLEDLDQLYRLAALMDRVEGRDVNNLLQSYTDIRPGRPTSRAHRDPGDDLRDPYDRRTAAFVSKLSAFALAAGAHEAREHYLEAGPRFADPIARMLFAELASIEEQHATEYECVADAGETAIEKWVLHEASEVYAYWSCLLQEENTSVRAIWQRFLDYELGHLHLAMQIMKDVERRDPIGLLPTTLPEPIVLGGQREFVRRTLAGEVGLRPAGTRFANGGGDTASGERAAEAPDARSVRYREQLNSHGSPSDAVAEGYCWVPGTELAARVRAATGRIS